MMTEDITKRAGIGWFVLAVMIGTATVQASDFSAWNRRTQITFSGYTRPEPLTNFPALVMLGSGIPGFSYGDMLSAPNADLRFSDASGTNELAYEVDRWDTNGASSVWVQVPVLADSNTCIWVYWGRSGQAVPAYTTNGATWTEGYAGVWHLGETGSTCRDSTANGNNGSVSNATLGVSGRIGGGASFDGSNDWIQVEDNPSLRGMTNLTIETWVNDQHNDVNPRGFVSKRVSSGSNVCYFLYSQTNFVRFYVNQNNGGEIPNTALGSNLWRHLVATFDPALATDEEKIYLDGGFAGARSNIQSAVANVVSPLCIGILHPNYGYGWLGQLDEVRISRVTRSTNWIWASWMSQASNSFFATVPASIPGVTNLAATGVMAGSATLNGTLLTTGQAPATVSVYWGPVDGGMTAGGWATNVTFAGFPAPGPLSTNVGLAPDTVYYYRYQATNAFGASWATPAAALMTGDVGIEAVDSAASESGPNTGVFSIFRPAWATGMVSRVAYSITGTASNGVDYVSLTNRVDIPVGATNVLVTVTPITDADYIEPSETVTLTLEPGAYRVGASNTATVTITNSQPSTVAVVSGTGDDMTGDGTVAYPFRSITRALTNTPSYALVYVGAGSYTTNSGEVFPLVVPGTTSLIGLGGAADAVIDAGSAFRGLTLGSTSSLVTNLVGNLSLLNTKGTAIVGDRWQGTLTNLVISGVANGGAVQTCSVISYTNSSSRKITLSGVVVSNVLCNVQKFMWFRGLGTVSFVNCEFRNLETTVAPASEIGTFFFTGVDGFAAGNTGFSCTLTDCIMDGITVPGVASTRAAVFMTGNGASFTLDRCVVRNVTLSGVGTTMFAAELGNGNAKNCLFHNIECGSYSLFGGYLAEARLRNCTIQDVSGVFRPQALIEADNCVISDCGTLNLVTQDSLYLKNVNTYNTAIGVGYNEANSTNVTTLDPWFVNAAGGDFHLRTLSPLVDAGNNGYMADARDLDKATRTLDGNADGTATVDLGAYEVNFMAPATARFMTAFPAYNVNEGQVLQVPVWIQPPVAGSVTAAVTYGTNVGGVATLNFPTGSETNTLSITVQSPLSVSNATRVAVSLAESNTTQGVSAGDIGLILFRPIVTVPGYQARAFVRAGMTNQYHVQMPDETLVAVSNLTVTVGSVGGAGSNSVTWVGSNVITAGTWRTEGYLQVVGSGGENTIGISIDGGMSFAESDSSTLSFAFVGYDTPVYIAPDGDDAAGLGTAAAPLKSLTFAMGLLHPGDEARMAAGLYSTNSGEVFPVTVPEGITVRGTMGATAGAADSSVIDADGSGFNFVLGTLGPDPGIQGEGGLFNLVLTDAKGTAIRVRYWGGSVSNCVIRDVINGGAQDSTAGVRVENSGRSVTLVDLTVTNINSDASRILLMEGGSTATLSRCQFRNLALSATSADGVFAFTDHLVSVTDCVFGNIAWPQTAGGGVDGGFLRVYNNVRGSLMIDRCIFHHLTVSSGDNMIVCPNRTVPTNIRNSLFHNIAGGSVRPVIGQVLSNPQVRNCTIDGAVTAFRGGSDTNYSIYVYNSSVSYCSNLCSAFGSQLRLNSVNVYATAGGLSYDTTNSTSVTAVEPMFIDRTNANYRLHPRSPLVDAGLTNYVLSTLDLARTNRIMAASVDLGAYENPPPRFGSLLIVQ